jgi:hypothetical protein
VHVLLNIATPFSQMHGVLKSWVVVVSLVVVVVDKVEVLVVDVIGVLCWLDVVRIVVVDIDSVVGSWVEVVVRTVVVVGLGEHF